jgi:hypothetical protein
MRYQTLTLFCAIIIVLSACKKDMSGNMLNTTNENALDESGLLSSAAGTVDTSNHWYGTYTGNGVSYPAVPDDSIIKSGGAQLPRFSRKFAFTNIKLDIPAKHLIAGDSATFEASVKNTKNTGKGSLDVALQIVGDKHSANVRFVADSSVSNSTNLAVGSTAVNGSKALVHYFRSFENVRFAFKDYTAFVYVNDSLVEKLTYGKVNSIGRIKNITVAFRGYGICNTVILRNSFTKKQILSESFNFDGQSHVLYY